MGSFEIVSVGARMSPIVHLHQVLRAHMRVAPGRAETAVAEELLDKSQIRAFAEHVGGEAVAKGVGSDAALDPRRSRPALDDAMHPSGGEAAAAWIGEERPSPRTVSHASSAWRATSPAGTTRSLPPLPMTRTEPCCRSKSSRSRPQHSATRSPVA